MQVRVTSADPTKATLDVLALPCFPELTVEEQKAVVQAIKEFYES